MSEQTTLFAAKTRRRATDPDTSLKAALSLDPSTWRASQRRVVQLFRMYGNMDDRALRDVARSEKFTISDSGLRTRRSELSKPNTDRLDRLRYEYEVQNIHATDAEADEWARETLAVEGYRSPLIDTGKRVQYEQGREGIVWGLVDGA